MVEVTAWDIDSVDDNSERNQPKYQKSDNLFTIRPVDERLPTGLSVFDPVGCCWDCLTCLQLWGRLCFVSVN